MRQSEWEPFYQGILNEFGYLRSEDETCGRLMESLTVNSNLVDEDYLTGILKEDVTVLGDGGCIGRDIDRKGIPGTIVCAGASVERLQGLGIVPDILVTDLDGDVGLQAELNNSGVLAIVHAHGDNMHLVQSDIQRFKGPIMTTMQSSPHGNLHNFGGFTDGDRAVCICSHFNVKRINLVGFDFNNATLREGKDVETKIRKLAWARKIITYCKRYSDICF